MLIGSLLRFSSNKDENTEKDNESDDTLMSMTLSKKLSSLNDRPADQTQSNLGPDDLSVERLTEISRKMLLDENLDISRVGPFFRTLVEIYVDRFQQIPFDTVKALFCYLELNEFPDEEVRDLVRRLETQYEKHHGRSLDKQERLPDNDMTGAQTLDQEISELRDTLKYAAIVAERIDYEK